MPSSEPRPELVMSSSTGMVMADHSKPRTACCDHSLNTMKWSCACQMHEGCEMPAGSSRIGNIVALGLALAMGVPNHLDVGDGNESLIDHHLQDWQELLDLGFLVDDAHHHRQVGRREEMLAMNARAGPVSFDASIDRRPSQIEPSRFLDDGLVQRLAVPAVVLAEVDPNHLGAAVQPHELSSLAAAPGSSRCVYLM